MCRIEHRYAQRANRAAPLKAVRGRGFVVHITTWHRIDGTALWFPWKGI